MKGKQGKRNQLCRLFSGGLFADRVMDFSTALPKNVFQNMRQTRNCKEVLILGRYQLLAFSLAILVLFTFETNAATLEIGGVISEKIYQGSEIVNTASNWFVVTIDGKNTRIKAGAMGDRSISFFEYGILDKDSYLLINYVTNLLVTESYQIKNGNAVKVKLATPRPIENSATITLYNGGVPAYDLGMLSPVWLAYCFNLGSEHSETDHAQDSPIFSMGDDFRKLGGLANMAYTLNPSLPNMLQTLVESGESKRFELLKLPSPSRGVFTNLIYEVSMWTNLTSFALPQRFHATSDLVMGPSGIINSLKIVFEGTATNFVLNSPSIPAFSIPKVTRVVDRRSSMVAPLTEFVYTTTNGVLLSREKLLMNNNYLSDRSDMSKSRRAPQSSIRWRLIVIIAFGLITFLGVVVWWFVPANKRLKSAN